MNSYQNNHDKSLILENIQIFERILKLEISNNYSNTSVSGGGLDEYIEKNIVYLIPILRNIEDKYGKKPLYSSADNKLRKLFCDRFIKEIDNLKKNNSFSSKKTNNTLSVSKNINTKKTLSLKSDIKSLGRVSKKIISMFEKLGIKTLEDLINYFPKRHRDFNDVKKVQDLIPGEVQTVVLKVWEAKTARYRNGVNATIGILGDDTGNVKVQWFGRSWLVNQLKPGVQVIISGKVNVFRGTLLFSSNFEYEIIGNNKFNDQSDLTHVGRFVPVYPLSGQIHQRSIRTLVRKAVNLMADSIGDYLPDEIVNKANLIELKNAVKQYHYPETLEDYNNARKRIVFDEFFMHQCAWLLKRKEYNEIKKAYKIRVSWNFIDSFFQSLSFTPTKSQLGVIREIAKDLNHNVPMARLLQGEVGSGKTLVAVVSALAVINANYKSAIMAPTEILAEQHYISTLEMFDSVIKISPFHSKLKIKRLSKEISIGLFLGSMPEKIKQDMRESIKNGVYDFLIGTHTLIQDNIRIPNLGLSIIDEQHRFGVLQRAAIKSSEKYYPHSLTMSATPIPRTLALTAYGDLDLSEINEMPFGERNVKTKLISPDKIKAAYNHLKNEIEKGRQVIVICPLIEESEKLNSSSAEEEYANLKNIIFPDYNIGLLHGRLNLDLKEDVMKKFRNGDIDLLVSTTVIEVGVDVPNASVMMIQSADRFGLSQLHQLRGRVGRGKYEGYCILVSGNENEDTIERLKIFERMSSGFELANEDLKIRGEGDITHTRQSGIPLFKVADLIQDKETQELSRKMAEYYVVNNFDEFTKNNLLFKKVKIIKEQMEGKLN
ncbi:MAG: ATP-dependent DNA helicase RecG [Chloroflexi bacterium]|jgi:ATP-dependent DNA helicase RecG|nr:ATP-dependent DNA helicase RecG [Chloroflexota bacterium]